MKTIYKNTGEVVKVFDIVYDSATGHPQFLIYIDGQWMRMSAKYFKPIDAESVRYGHWIEDHMNWRCSCCEIVFNDELERIISYDGRDMPKYCPECGAKMDLEE